eukprot:COSAG02_NODE_10802_length_1855_cov_7.530706_3_plen_54_part_01
MHAVVLASVHWLYDVHCLVRPVQCDGSMLITTHLVLIVIDQCPSEFIDSGLDGS